MNPLAKLTLVLFVIEVVLFVASASVPAYDEQTLLSTFHNLTDAVNGSVINDFVLIYSNNAVITLASSLPFVGVLIMLLVIFNTGQVVSAAAAALFGTFSVPSSVAGGLVAILLVLMPHGTVEFLSYAIASATSLRTGLFVLKRYPLSFIAKYFITFLLMSLFNLAVAALLESVEITFSLGGSVIGVFSLWVFALPYLIGLYYLQRKLEIKLLASSKEGSDRYPQPSVPQP
ncbi:MAG: stage II sporulation protein M [Sulfolobales archaeon]|nr:stage II sporulation protein M [Sulfolobales archaeon]